MAKTRTITRTVVARAPTPTIRISAPAGNIARRAGRRARGYARSAGRAVVSEKHTITAILAAMGFGFIEKSGWQIPSIGPVGPAGTAGLVAWAIGRSTKSQMAQHIATGLLCVAANRFAATGTIAGEGYTGDDT